MTARARFILTCAALCLISLVQGCRRPPVALTASELSTLPEPIASQGKTDGALPHAPVGANSEREEESPTARIMGAITRTAEPPPFKLVEVGSHSNISSSQTLPESQPASVSAPSRDTVEELWQARGEAGQFGGTLTVSTFGTAGIKTFNFWQASEVESSGLAQLMFDPLVDADPWTAKIYPRLAKSFTISSDECEYTFRLRKGLKWSDGYPLTANDVLFTFNTLVRKGYGNSSYRDTISVAGEFPEVTKIDELTVKFRTKKPFAPFLMNLKGIAIAPEHAMKEIVKQPMDAFHGFWDMNMRDPLHNLVVSGPFIVKRYVHDQRVELVRNPHYSMVDKLGRRLPYLDGIILLIVPDQNTELIKFYGHEIDFLDIRAVRGSDAALMKQREINGGDFKIYNLGPDDGTMFLMFNLCRRKDPKTNRYYVDPVKQKWFNNLLFRQAINHAVPRDRVVNNALRGVGMPLFTSESPAALYVNSRLKPFPDDLKLAREMLEQAGFVTKNGLLYDDQGNRVEFRLETNSGNTTRDATCVIVQDRLKELGIKANYHPIDFNILIDKTETSLDWEAVVMGLTGDKLEPYEGANVWKTDGRIHMYDQRLPDDDGTTRVTDARPWEKEIDRCFDLGASTFDLAERHKYFDRYQQIVYEQAPYIYLYSSLNLTAIRNTIGNYRPTPWGIYYTPKGSLHNIEEIYVKRDKRAGQ